MKDYLKMARIWNVAPRNRTQTYYTRFLKGPSAEIKSQFTESQKAFKKFGEDAMKTRYSELLGE